MITVRTAAIIKAHYPADVLVDAQQNPEKKWASFCYHMRDGHIHSLLLSTTFIFESQVEAKTVMQDIVKEIVTNPNE